MLRSTYLAADCVRIACNGRIYRCAVALLFLALLFAAVRPSWGQQPTATADEYTIKAAYLYNFIRYIEWPSSAFPNAESPIVIGVVGPVPSDLDRSLSYYEKSKKVRGRTIQIRRFRTADDIGNCHLLFLTKSIESNVLKDVVEKSNENPILLVGETSDFLERGGAINFVMASNKVRFQLDVKETQSKGLKPSAKLLQVAYVSN